MKKLIALAVAILMIAAMAVPAFAAKLGSTPEVTEDIVLDDGDTVDGNVYGDENANNAGTPTTDAENTVNEGTRLIYGVGQSYIVSIPADIVFEECLTTTSGKTVGYVYSDYEIGLYDVVIAGDEYMKVTVASAQTKTAVDAGFVATAENPDTKTAWTLIDTEGTKSSAAVNYYLTTDAFMTDIADDEEANDWMDATKAVLEVDVQDGNAGTAGNEGTAHIYFSSKGTAQEGTYKDIITFTVSVLPDNRVVTP